MITLKGKNLMSFFPQMTSYNSKDPYNSVYILFVIYSNFLIFQDVLFFPFVDGCYCGLFCNISASTGIVKEHIIKKKINQKSSM